MNTIEINGKSYKVKQTIRSLFLWEQIAGRPFEVKTTLDNYLYYYALILANNKDATLEWDEFIDAIDGDPTIVLNMTKAIADQSVVDKLLDGAGEADKNGKKKKTDRKRVVCDSNARPRNIARLRS